MNEERKDMILKSLKKKRFGWKYSKWTASKNIEKFLVISYYENLPLEFALEFEVNNITILEVGRQDRQEGYFTWDEKGNRNGFYWDGTPVQV